MESSLLLLMNICQPLAYLVCDARKIYHVALEIDLRVF